ncbi:MAG: hypothetical protein GEU68_02475 [Actinobacteria bacterium]|nr:hypothetical protein [Actinomycetota bacterium]
MTRGEHAPGIAKVLVRDPLPLIERIDDDVYGRILEDSRAALGRFCTDDGKAEIPIEGHVITARKR